VAVACLLAGAQTVRLAAAITLAWTHSVQKSAWQEDWRASSDGLVLAEVRVEGSGAGMEPPDDAVLKGGFYVAHPALAPQRQVILRRSGATADWQICITGACRPMAELVPPDADPVTLTTCE
jgi:hypothetical protein